MSKASKTDYHQVTSSQRDWFPVTTPISSAKIEVMDSDCCWLARSPNDGPSGYLIYSKTSGEFGAGASLLGIYFSKLGQGQRNQDSDWYLDEDRKPRGELLMLFALRERLLDESSGWEIDMPHHWRRMAFKARWLEVEKETGRPVSAANREISMEIASSPVRFEKYVGELLASKARDAGASNEFSRIAKWLKKIEEIEEQGIPPRYLRFFRSVESAARNARGIPTIKSARRIYDSGLSANQKGQGSSFDSLKKQLGFLWLPAGGRGAGKIQKKTGVRSQT